MSLNEITYVQEANCVIGNQNLCSHSSRVNYIADVILWIAHIFVHIVFARFFHCCDVLISMFHLFHVNGLSRMKFQALWNIMFVERVKTF